MFILVHHAISNPTEFWATVQREMPNTPKEMRCHMALPNKEGNRASCLWEAPSVATLDAYLDKTTGQVCKNEFMVIEAANAFGLPK